MGQLGSPGVDVGAGVERTAQGLHHLADVAIGPGPVNPLVVHEHDLPAAGGQVQERGLVGHGPREPEAIEQRLALIPVLPAPDPAEGRTADGVVDPHERAQARSAVVDGGDLLEALSGHGIKDVD